ncbi:MAG TPA: hypothetical protein VGV15_20390, partial [Terriglobales bacterium]|nr:hypothetical protein [Terriglobales bacterium]
TSIAPFAGFAAPSSMHLCGLRCRRRKIMTLEEVEQMPDAEARKLYDALLMLVDAGFIRVDKADGQELDTDMGNTLIIHGGQAHARHGMQGEHR